MTNSDPLHLHNPKPTHPHHYGHHKALFMLIPSMIFVLVLALYLRFNRQVLTTQHYSTASAEDMSTKIEKFPITVGDTEVLVTIADTDAERARGLSGVTNLPGNEGKLFTFDHPDTRNPFWMKDMYISIDIIWINDGVIAQIHENVPAPEPGTPDSQLKLYAPDSPYDYVLEVNAGYSDQNNWGVGTPIDLSRAL